MINKLEISASSDVLISLKRLEKVSISKQILFRKVTIIPKGNFSIDISNVLSRDADSNGLVVLKLKRKMTYRSHVNFEAVCSELLNQALMYLKENNPL